MKKDKNPKTNAMRELERAHIAYEAEFYDADGEDISKGVGLRISEMLGEDPESAFKTLVCVSPKGEYVVCCVPVALELDLKRAAEASQQKSLALINWHDLEQITGYVRGGCTPVGMKKQFCTVFDESALLYEKIGISGGKRGVSLRVNPEELGAFLNATFADIAR